MKYKLSDRQSNGFYRVILITPMLGLPAGEIGGYVSGEYNLSQTGNAWISDNARVFGDARVSGNAWVSDNAWVSSNARVFGDARVSGNAWISDNARVFGDAQVSGNAWISDNARVFGDARV